MEGECDGDGSGAGADVDEGLGLVVGETREDGFDEVFGLGARDEDGGSDVEGEAVELLVADDVLDGFEGEAAGDGGFVTGGLVGGEFAVGVREKSCAGERCGLEEEEFGVAKGVVAKVVVCGESGGGGGDGLAKGHR